MAGKIVNRRLRRNSRLVGWTVCLLASIVPFALPAGVEGQGRFLWLILPAAVLVGWHRWMKDEGAVPVIVYHGVSADQSWLPWAFGTVVTPETFERHLRILRDLGCNVISTRELLGARVDGRPLPKRPVAIHFDDGLLDNWTAAAPLLRRYEMKATLFVSLDFIEQSTDLRPNLDDVLYGRAAQDDLRWSGYLNWAELKELDSSGIVDVQAHGVDHGRVPTGPGTVGEVAPGNWRRHAWVQWAAMNGNKSSWYLHGDPPAVPYGAPIPESAPALAARAWRDGRLESEKEYEDRVRTVLERSRRELGSALAKKIEVFCWPFNAATETGRRIAGELGYAATTGGRGENRRDEDPRVISRMTVLEHTTSLRSRRLEDLIFAARVRAAQGVYYWNIVLLPLSLLRRLLGGPDQGKEGTE